jgi:PTS system glucose-specific IIC component
MNRGGQLNMQAFRKPSPGTVQVKEVRVEGKSGKTKSFISKLAKGLMLPIALLPIAGIFLGVGAAIQNIATEMGTTSGGIFIAADVFKVTGDMIFGNLPILFAVGVAIAYTEDAGVAGLSALVG